MPIAPSPARRNLGDPYLYPIFAALDRTRSERGARTPSLAEVSRWVRQLRGVVRTADRLRRHFAFGPRAAVDPGLLHPEESWGLRATYALCAAYGQSA